MARGALDIASIAVKLPTGCFHCRYYKSSTSSQMADMNAYSSCLPPLSVAAGLRDRPILTKKWPCPCGKVVPTVQTPESKKFGTHFWGA